MKKTANDKKLTTINTLLKDEGDKSTLEINHLLNTYDRILVVIDETHEYKYVVEALNNHSIYKIITEELIGKKVIIPLRKFIYLARHRLLRKEDYQTVVFRIPKCNKELIDTFKIFYYANLKYGECQPLIVAYFCMISQEDYANIHCKYNKMTKEDIVKPKIYNIFVSPIHDNELNEYLDYKLYLIKLINASSGNILQEYNVILKKIERLEHITYRFGLHLLRKSIKYNYKKDIKHKFNEVLLINDYKFKKTKRIINSNTINKVYVNTKIPFLIDYLKTEVDNKNAVLPYKEQNLNVHDGILIMYDDIIKEFLDRDFKRIYVFRDELTLMGDKDKTDNYLQNFDQKNTNTDDLVNELSDLILENEKTKFDNIFEILAEESQKKDQFYIKKTAATVNFDFGYLMLTNFFVLLQSMYKDEHFYLKNLNFDFSYTETDGLCVCLLKLPTVHKDFEPIRSKPRNSKNDARKYASLIAFDFLHKNGFMDDYLCPVKEKFIDKNVLFYKTMIKTYKIYVSLASEADKGKYDCYNKLFNGKKHFNFEIISQKTTQINELFYCCVEQAGVDNSKLKEILTNYKQNQIELILQDTKITPVRAKQIFEKDYGVILETNTECNEETTIYNEIKQSEATKNYGHKYHIYTFSEQFTTKIESNSIENNIDRTQNMNTLTNNQFLTNNLGIAISPSFTDTLKYQNITICYAQKIIFNDFDYKCLMFFQVILFLLNFKKIREIKGNTKNYCYFIVPIKNNQVDFECLHCFAPKNFLKGNIYQNLHSEHLKTNFLYNPFNKTFYLFDKISKRKITEQETFNKETKTFLEFFEERYNTNLLLKEGDNLLIDGYLFNGKKTEITNVLSAEIMQLTSIPENICNSFEKVMKNFYALEKACLSHEFIEKHRLKLSNQIVLQCFCAKEEEYDNYERLEFLGDSVLKFVTTKHIFLSENNEHEMIVLQNKNSVNKDANKNETQTKALYNTDVNTNYNDRNVQNIVDYNDMGDIVTEKDKYISNKSLYGIASSLDITSFFSFTKYSSSLFQPPNIGILVDNSVDTQFKEECKNIISYFQAEKIFASKNVSYHENKALQDETKIRGSKTYADIVEALIGAHFVELGFKISEEFIHGIGVYDKYKKNNNLEKCYRTVIYDNNATENNKEHVLPDRMPNTVENKAELINNKKAKHNNSRKIGLEKIDCGLLIKKATVYYKDTKLVKEMKIYKNILTEKEIEDIENILNYKFKNKGLIEKAMIHPSSHRNILGSLQFNRLELLGDSALDLVITEYIYDKHKDFDPEKLHVKRKSYVNNFSLARVLFKSNLFRYLHICFDYEHVQNVIKKLKTDGETVNKAFGDVFESVCGAIVVDMDFCFYTFKNYVLTNLYSYLFDCKDETR